MGKTRQPPRQDASWDDHAFFEDGELQDEDEGVAYRVVRFLGRGGMGEVYEVVRADSGARYALKCLRLEHVKNEKTIERTRREALTLRALRHRHVVRVHATGVRADGLIWMVMDLLHGFTLADIRDRFGKLPLPWVLRVGAAVAEGLEAVHAYAVHRDIKPENIHLGTDAVVRVLDLGAGKFHHRGLLTTGGGVLGTVPYMSPEQLAKATTLDGRSDLFSLGVVLAELLSGVHLFALQGFASENVYTLVRKIVGPEPISLRTVAPWAPGHVVEAIDRALAKDRALRYASAGEMRAALAAALERLEGDVGRGAPLSALVAELSPRGLPSVRFTDPLSATVTALDGDDEEPEEDTAVMRVSVAG